MTQNEDPEVLRVMISSDNHLGFCEKDPVRSNDSFAAFSEVLSLARSQGVDMVLLSGDMFHDNKPSRATLHKTFGILRKFTQGENPVKFAIVSDQVDNFRTPPVNFEDPYLSVDLPVFSIHGNHDDPCRDGQELLAALDLLSETRLVNYFGREDEVDKIEVKPILMRKGENTKVALYGLGAMREERLNRMWSKKKVRFVRPAEDVDRTETENPWFNIFALHQNRDYGRGAKSCVHESFLPEWLDLVVWGHEHESIEKEQESLVGTFRILQPGSSVATSLCYGEERPKNCFVLDVRGEQFRISNNPISKVRGFAMSDVSLQDEPNLSPDDPKIDEKIGKFLEGKVKELIKLARDNYKEAQATAQEFQEGLGGDDKEESVYSILQPELVLVRLRVEHTGFTTINNQRFGAQFVGDVANPGDMLLFHRKKRPVDGPGGGGGGKKKKKDLSVPVMEDPAEELTVEELIKDNLMTGEKKMEVLDEQQMTLALESFVKGSTSAIVDSVGKRLMESSKKLSKNDALKAVKDVRTIIAGEADDRRARFQEEEDEEGRREKAVAVKRRRLAAPGAGGEGDDDSVGGDVVKEKVKGKKAPKRRVDSDEESDEEESEGEEPPPLKKSRRQSGKPKKSYVESGGEEESDGGDAVVDMTLESDDDDVVVAPKKKASPKRKSPARKAKPSPRRKGGDSDESEDDEEVQTYKGFGGGGSSRKSSKK